MRRAPTDLLSQENAANLAAPDPDAVCVGCFDQGIKGPVRFGVGIRRHQRAVRQARDRTGRRALRKSDELAPFRFGQPGFTPLSRPISKPVDSLRIETGETLANGLRMAAHFVRNRGGPQAIPASDNHARPQDPIARRMATLGQSTDVALLDVILGSSGMQEFRHRRLPSALTMPLFYDLFEEWSTR
jgi:hypothetical protein